MVERIWLTGWVWRSRAWGAAVEKIFIKWIYFENSLYTLIYIGLPLLLDICHFLLHDMGSFCSMI